METGLAARYLLALVSPVHPVGVLLLYPLMAVWAGRRFGSRGIAAVSGVVCVATLALPFVLRSSNPTRALAFFALTLALPVVVSGVTTARIVATRPPFVTYLVAVLAATAAWFGGLLLALALFGVAASVA